MGRKQLVMVKVKSGAPPKGTVKFTVPVPEDVYQALGLHSHATGVSQSTVVRQIVEARFSSGRSGALKQLSQPKGETWRRLSIFIPPAIKARATNEVQRQLGKNEDARRTGSLAAVIAALCCEQFCPKLYATL